MPDTTAAAPAAVQPVIVTPDLERLQRFYTELLGAEETTRVPEEGSVFFVGLRIGNGELVLVADENVETGSPVRILLNIAVQDVDGLLERVAPLGGKVSGPPNDMPWGQRVAHIQDPDGNAVNLSQPV
ncbi:extradiol dioxygenase [Streptomyces piniterrae]|uniref:Extradiol dioxygenase n=1 Tax=Streptomyces piniterrae TaxID=2571125 RepID=A0A4U0N7K9_9ACTN|nr:VOC family protein [Streptomyces piniterrae]TJZ49546.1 extradiol dioxygenase [Streptomyces piniterrae]